MNLNIGRTTVFGTVVAVLYTGERYYFMLDENGTVSLIPATALTTQTDQLDQRLVVQDNICKTALSGKDLKAEPYPYRQETP